MPYKFPNDVRRIRKIKETAVLQCLPRSDACRLRKQRRQNAGRAILTLLEALRSYKTIKGLINDERTSRAGRLQTPAIILAAVLERPESATVQGVRRRPIVGGVQGQLHPIRRIENRRTDSANRKGLTCREQVSPPMRLRPAIVRVKVSRIR